MSYDPYDCGIEPLIPYHGLYLNRRQYALVREATERLERLEAIKEETFGET